MERVRLGGKHRVHDAELVAIGVDHDDPRVFRLADVDPAVVRLNEDLGRAREELERSKAAASESWATLQGGVNDAFETLRTSVRKAYSKAKQA